jgi:hypothetical protein
MSAGFFIFIYILGSIIFGAFTSWIAGQKGRSTTTWFFLGLFFGMLAFLAVGLAPKEGENTSVYLTEILKYLKQEKSQEKYENDIPIAKKNGDTWTCSKCGTENAEANLSCKDCGTYK